MNETIASELKDALEGFSGAETELTKYFQEIWKACLVERIVEKLHERILCDLTIRKEVEVQDFGRV